MQLGFFFADARKSLIEQSAIPVVFLHGQQFLLISAGVEFHAAHARQIIAFFLEEQSVKQGFHRFFSRRFTRAHHAVNCNFGGLLISRFVRIQRCRNVRTRFGFAHKQSLDFFNALNIKLRQQFFCDFRVCRCQHFTRIRHNHITRDNFANQTFSINIQAGKTGSLNIANISRIDALACRNQHITLIVGDIKFCCFTAQALRHQRRLHTCAG